MAKIPSISCMIDTFASAHLMDYDLTHDPCAPGVFAYAKRLYYLMKSGEDGSTFSYAYMRRLGLVGGENDDGRNYDRPRDFVCLGAAVLIIACVFGIIHSFAVFAPAIQHSYTTGVVETIFVGCLCYAILISLVPLSSWICQHLEHRRTCLAGMTLFLLGVLLDAFTINVYTFYVSHLLFMSVGGSLAYTAAMTVCAGRFRKRLGLALSALTCAGNFGAIIVFLFTNFLTNYVSYMWVKLSLVVVVLICTTACQAFPLEPGTPFNLHRSGAGEKAELKRCVRNAIMERDRQLRQLNPEFVPQKSFNCICVCDLSVCTDYSFLLWALVCMLALMTNFVPYLYLVARAYEVGTSMLMAAVCLVSIASIATRYAFMGNRDHTFMKNKLLFQGCCFLSGIFYILLIWVTTTGWLLMWAAVVGAIEGTEMIVIPRVTLALFPYKSIQSCTMWIVQFHAIAIVIGPMIIMTVGYYSLVISPAFVAIGIAQVIAALLATLVPNMDAQEMEYLEEKYGPVPQLENVVSATITPDGQNRRF